MKEFTEKNIGSRKFLGWLVACSMLLLAFAVRAGEVPKSTGQVNINTASVNQLMLLEGIGSSKAQAIVDFRKQNPFSNAGELIQVKGIGKKLLSRIQNRVVTRGATTARALPKKKKNTKKKTSQKKNS